MHFMHSSWKAAKCDSAGMLEWRSSLTGTISWQNNFLARMAYAGFPARFRWMTQRFTARGERSGFILRAPELPERPPLER